MQEGGSQRLRRWFASVRLLLSCSLLGLAAATAGVVISLGWGNGSTQKLHAAPDNVNVNINTNGCHSDGATTKCTETTGGSFTVNFAITALPTQGSYGGYDLEIMYPTAIVNYVAGSLAQTGAGTWPSCGFPVGDGASPRETPRRPVRSR